MLDDHIDVHEEAEHNSKKAGMSPDPEKQSKNGFLGDLDGASKDEEERMTSLKRVFKRAFIYSTVFTVIVAIIGRFFHPRMIFR